MWAAATGREHTRLSLAAEEGIAKVFTNERPERLGTVGPGDANGYVVWVWPLSQRDCWATCPAAGPCCASPGIEPVVRPALAPHAASPSSATLPIMQPWAGTEDRRVFFVVVNESVDLVMHFTGPPRTPVLEVLTLLVEFDRKQNKGALPREGYDLYAWGGIALPDFIRMYEVPAPGIVIAIHRSPGGANSASAYGIRKLLEQNKDHLYGQRIDRFLASSEAKFEPIPIAKHDVFLSHSVKDAPVVKEITERLERAGLTTFLAPRDLPGGAVWTQELRDALASSRLGLLLLTPSSLGSDWVMCEVGALWALGKNIVPALIGVRPDKVPEILSTFQFREIGVPATQLEPLIADVARLCQVMIEPESAPTLPAVDLSQRPKVVKPPRIRTPAKRAGDDVGARRKASSKKRAKP